MFILGNSDEVYGGFLAMSHSQQIVVLVDSIMNILLRLELISCKIPDHLIKLLWTYHFGLLVANLSKLNKCTLIQIAYITGYAVCVVLCSG